MRHRRWRSALWLVMVLWWLPAPVVAVTMQTVPVVVVTSAGHEHLFRAELADTPRSRARGLMFRDQLDIDAGMLFVFDGARVAQFWMKNTLIPLDMLFVDASGRIVDIVVNATPQTLEPRGPTIPVVAVLEINGGLSEELGIRPGDTVRAPAFAAGTPLN